MSSSTGRTGTWNPNVDRHVTSTGGTTPPGVGPLHTEFTNESAHIMTASRAKETKSDVMAPLGSATHRKRGTLGAKYAPSAHIPAQSTPQGGTTANGKLMNKVPK
jgi:hypothetical protein